MAGPSQGGGTIDVKPSTLHQVAGGFAGQQTPFDKGAKDLLSDLKEYPDAGGYGTAPQAFAAAYLKAANLFMDVWAASVASVGGAAVGFATTANNYSKAEAANDPSGKTQAQVQPPPVVIDKPPKYESVTDLKWGDDDGGDDFIRTVLEWIPDVVWHIIRPLLEDEFRWGKVAEVYPFPQQHYLKSLSEAWDRAGQAVDMTMGNLDGLVSGITQQSNSEWYDAMRQFCSSLWGSSVYGTSTADYQWKHDSSSAPGATHPVAAVLHDTSQKISARLVDLAEAAVDLNHKVWEIYFRAVKQALGDIDLSDGVDLKDLKEGAKGVGRFVKGLVTGGAEAAVEITLNIDTAALNRVVEKYNHRVDALTPQLAKLMDALNEAHLSAPTYAAEEARAENFGSRSLNEFKQEHKWTNPNDKNHGRYPMDLAGQEGFVDDRGRHSHVIDKHTGKTDDQLIQRFRDDLRPNGTPYPGSSSTFKDLPSAQRFAQGAIDHNSPDIQAWLQNQPAPNPAHRSLVLPVYDANETTGRSVTKADYLNHGTMAQVDDVEGVKVMLKYDQSLDPPFFVYTAYPAKV